MAQHGAASDRAFDMNEPLDYLTLVDYRYARLAFHPALHRFMLIGYVTFSLFLSISLPFRLTVLISYWKGPNWVTVKNVKTGLTSEQYRQRLSVFGPNLINIREKPTTKLLRDEVTQSSVPCISLSNIYIGPKPFLRIPNRQHYSLVHGRLLLLCLLYLHHQCRQHHYYIGRDKEGMKHTTMR